MTQQAAQEEARQQNLINGQPDVQVDGMVTDVVGETVTTRNQGDLTRYVLEMRLNGSGQLFSAETTSEDVGKKLVGLAKKSRELRVTFTIRCNVSNKEGKRDRIFSNLVLKDVAPIKGVSVPDELSEIGGSPVSLLTGEEIQLATASATTGDVA